MLPYKKAKAQQNMLHTRQGVATGFVMPTIRHGMNPRMYIMLNTMAILKKDSIKAGMWAIGWQPTMSPEAVLFQSRRLEML